MGEIEIGFRIISSALGFVVSPARKALLATLPPQERTGLVEKIRGIVQDEISQVNSRLQCIQEEGWRSALVFYSDALRTIDGYMDNPQLQNYLDSMDPQMPLADIGNIKTHLKNCLDNAQSKAVEALNSGVKLQKESGGFPILDAFAIRESCVMFSQFLTMQDTRQSVRIIVNTWKTDIHAQFLYNNKHIQQCLNNNLGDNYLQKKFQFKQKKEGFEKLKSLLVSLAGAAVSLSRLVSSDNDSIELIKQFVYNIDRPAQMKKEKYQGFLETQLVHIRGARAIEFQPSQEPIVQMPDDDANEVIPFQPPAPSARTNGNARSGGPVSIFSRSQERPSNDIPNLSAVVNQWAKELWSMVKTKSQARINIDEISFDINWDEVWFEFDCPEYLFLFDHAALKRVAFSDSCANSTSREQSKTFKGEGSAVSTASVVLERGFCRGTPVAFDLKLPEEIVQAFPGFGHYLNISHRQGQTQTVHVENQWHLDTTVTVPAHTEVKCILIVTEVQGAASFKINSRFSGRVHISVNHKNETLTTLQGHIRDIFRHALDRGGRRQFRDFKIEDGVVCVEIAGKCSFKYVLDKKEKLTERVLDMQESD